MFFVNLLDPLNLTCLGPIRKQTNLDFVHLYARCILYEKNKSSVKIISEGARLVIKIRFADMT